MIPPPGRGAGLPETKPVSPSNDPPRRGGGGPPHLKKYWRIPPPASAALVACMEDVLAACARPYAERLPVVCMDETNKQLIQEVREKLPAEPGQPERWEHE